MKEVLLITYFWPPSGKATVHWPLAITKYLRHFEWNTSVLTVEEDTFSARDESLLAEVNADMRIVRTKPYDPFRLYRKLIGKKENEPLIASETISRLHTNWRHRFAIWLRMNLFVPDARIGWILSSPRGGRKIIAEKRPSVIVTIGPPHSAHLIGMKLSKHHQIPHVPVLIDPWVDIAYYREFHRSRVTVMLDSYLERCVLSHAAQVVFVTKDTRHHYVQKYPEIEKKSHVCYWGYNEENFTCVQKQHCEEEILLHAGNIFDFQNPPHLWPAIRKEIEQGRKLRIRFIGTVSPGIRTAINSADLAPFTEYVGFLSYSEVVQQMMNATYLLVCATEPRHVPGKLFEYMRTGNRIIAFGDDNEEVKHLLQQTRSGHIFPYAYHCTDLFEKLRTCTPNPNAARSFSREVIAEQFALVLSQAHTPVL